MFLILTYDSNKAWMVWYPNRTTGFATREEAEDRIAQNGARGKRYWVVETGAGPVVPERTVEAI